MSVEPVVFWAPSSDVTSPTTYYARLVQGGDVFATVQFQARFGEAGQWLVFFARGTEAPECYLSFAAAEERVEYMAKQIRERHIAGHAYGLATSLAAPPPSSSPVSTSHKSARRRRTLTFPIRRTPMQSPFATNFKTYAIAALRRFGYVALRFSGQRRAEHALDASYRSSEGALKKVGPGEEVTITVRMDVDLFVPYKLVVEPFIARYFEVSSIKVGRDEQLWSDMPLPATVFDPTSEMFHGERADDAVPRVLADVRACPERGQKAPLFPGVPRGDGPLRRPRERKV